MSWLHYNIDIGVYNYKYIQMSQLHYNIDIGVYNYKYIQMP